MSVEAQDPGQRWRSISAWYAEFSAEPHWEFLAPMVELTAWVAEQPFAGRLYTHTSHEWLCVHRHTGYKPNMPFFSCGVRRDGQFECMLWASAGKSRGCRVVPFSQAREVFAESVACLGTHGKRKRVKPIKAARQKGDGAEPGAAADRPRD